MTDNDEQMFKKYLEAAERGDVAAMKSVGDCYFCGEGVEEDPKKAFEWYGKAAEQGDAKAQYALGLCYFRGEHGEPDWTKAVDWWRKSAKQGELQAQVALAYLFSASINPHLDPVLAFCLRRDFPELKMDEAEIAYWWRQAAEQGDAEAQWRLGVCYSEGCLVDKDDAKSVEWFSKAAQQGQKNAQYCLGTRYRDGIGIEKSDKDALLWLRKAAEKFEDAERDLEELMDVMKAECGDAASMKSLGDRYENGEGVEKDHELAIIWWRRAAAQDNPDAKYALACCQLSGDGMELDEAKAIKSIVELADTGHADAMGELAEIRENAEAGDSESQFLLGLSLAGKDDAKSAEWLGKAAEGGLAKAQCVLGILYHDGKGIAKDENLALKWLERAAEAGNTTAQCKLGEDHYWDVTDSLAPLWFGKAADHGDARGISWLADCFENGFGVEKDLSKAIELRSRAADMGFPEAQAFLGENYLRGEGVPEDEERGRALLRIGCARSEAEDRRDWNLDAYGDSDWDFYTDILYDWPLIDDEEVFAGGYVGREEDEGRSCPQGYLRPFIKAPNAVFWARYINEMKYRNELGLCGFFSGESDCYSMDFWPKTELFQFYTLAEMDEFRRVFYWYEGNRNPWSAMLDEFYSKILEFGILNERDACFAIGQLSGVICKWFYAQLHEWPQRHPFDMPNHGWLESWQVDAYHGANRLRVIFNVILRASLVKMFGCYEKHIAALLAVIDNAFVNYEDYKAYVDALPADKNAEVYRRIRAKIGMRTESGYLFALGEGAAQ